MFGSRGLQQQSSRFSYAPYGDLEAVKKLIDRETCAIMIEPIQGEGGIRIPPAGFLKGLALFAAEQLRQGLSFGHDEVGGFE